jgi:hypothetical protein
MMPLTAGLVVVGGFSALLGACIHQAGSKTVELESGEEAERVECWTDKQECLDVAQETCPGGYRVLDDRHQLVRYGSGGGTRDLFTITIQCN